MNTIILPFVDRRYTRITPPILPAYRHPNSIQSLVWYQFCERYHWHGCGPRHRVAHCSSRGELYKTSGYVLVDAIRSGWPKRGVKYVSAVERAGGVFVVAKSPADALQMLAALT